MTPRAFSADVVTLRLGLMQELLEDLDAIGPVDATRLDEDRIVRRAVERILTQLIDLATDINHHVSTALAGPSTSEYRASFDAAAGVGLIAPDLAARLKPSVGLRNVLVHEYVRTDLGLVAEAVPIARQDYGEYVRSVAAWLRAV